MTVHHTIPVYIESSDKRAFAGALDWPGWIRSGRDEAAALEALAQYAGRYARVARLAGLEFPLPVEAAAFKVVERLAGGAGVDFGSMQAGPSADDLPAEGAELERLQALLDACWRVFSDALALSQGRELRKGPRGGGREREGVARHVIGAEESYLATTGWKADPFAELGVEEAIARARVERMLGMAALVRGELPTIGPRGGKRWTLRYYVRRSAWHLLDHAWEIEDRVI